MDTKLFVFCSSPALGSFIFFQPATTTITESKLDSVSRLSKESQRHFSQCGQCGKKDPDLLVEITFLEYQGVFVKSEALPCAKIKDLQRNMRR